MLAKLAARLNRFLAWLADGWQDWPTADEWTPPTKWYRTDPDPEEE